jgi:hypothetical protein
MARDHAVMPFTGVGFGHDVGNGWSLVFAKIAEKHKNQAILFCNRVCGDAGVFWRLSRSLYPGWNKCAQAVTGEYPAMLWAFYVSVFANTNR